MTSTPSNPVQSSQPKKAEAPHVPAAFINALAEEGTKTEAIWYLQKYWNEACALGARLKEATRLINEGSDTLEKLIKAEARVSELEKLVEGGLAAVNAARGEEQASMAGHDYTADKHAKTVTDWQRAARAALAMNSQDRA
jgi:hypothetical protein